MMGGGKPDRAGGGSSPPISTPLTHSEALAPRPLTVEPPLRTGGAKGEEGKARRRVSSALEVAGTIFARQFESEGEPTAASSRLTACVCV